MERDLAQQNLQEARKKFSDFQNDFQYELKNDLNKRVCTLLGIPLWFTTGNELQSFAGVRTARKFANQG